MVPGRQMEHHKQQLTVGSCKPEPKKDLWNSEQPARWPRDEYHVLRGKVCLSADYLEETIIDACLAYIRLLISDSWLQAENQFVPRAVVI